jgi:predicted hydrocarbon binding protein
VTRTQRGADAELVNPPAVSDPWCRGNTAYIKRLLELVGARDVSVAHVSCRARGGDKCFWRGRWA